MKHSGPQMSADEASSEYAFVQMDERQKENTMERDQRSINTNDQHTALLGTAKQLEKHIAQRKQVFTLLGLQAEKMQHSIPSLECITYVQSPSVLYKHQPVLEAALGHFRRRKLTY